MLDSSNASISTSIYDSHKEMVDAAHERDMSAGIQTVLMGIMPFYHVYGLVFAMCKRMGMGDKVVIMPKFEPRSFLRAIEKHKVEFMMATESHLYELYGYWKIA